MDLVHDTLGRLEEVRYPGVPGRERFALKNVYDAATGELVRRDDATDPLAPSMSPCVRGVVPSRDRSSLGPIVGSYPISLRAEQASKQRDRIQ